MSFRRRLTLLSAGAVAVAIIVTAAAAYLLVRSELRGQVDDSLRARAVVAATVAGPDFGDGRPPGIGDRRIPGGGGLERPATVAQFVDASGNVSGPGELEGETLPVEPATELLASGEPGPVYSDASVAGQSVRVISLVVGPGRAVQIARSLDEVDSALSRLAAVMVLIAVGGVAAATLLGFAVAGAALTPVKRLTETAEEVALTNDLSRRIEIGGGDELARLGLSFNEMLAALERSIGAQHQLVADASHELRTPITSLRTNIETLARRPEMPDGDRERLLDDLGSELEELGRLVDDIVDLARDGTEVGSRSATTEVRLDELVGACVERARRRAGETVTVSAELEPEVVPAVPERLDRAIGNLLDNAVKWTPPGGRIEVSVAGGVVTITDSGPGIEQEDLPHVFDRFYRARAARGTPGSGLGLAIVQQVADTHGGSVEAANAPSGGARMTLRLPGARKPQSATSPPPSRTSAGQRPAPAELDESRNGERR